jgi:putative ABC transport system ATP-binding protein
MQALGNSNTPSATSTEAAIRVTNASKVYAAGTTSEVRALDGVTLTIPAGTFVAVMGASGSGKSTLLHLMAGLATPTAGDVSLFNQSLAGMSDDALTRFRRRNVGLVFQTFNLLPTMTALENACLPELIDGKPLRAVTPKARAMLKLVGLDHYEGRRPDELSGGQQQRVAIARALMNDAPLVLADEPTGNLDSKTGDSVLILLRQLVKEHGRTIVMATHDPKAAAYADRAITLSDGKIADDLYAMLAVGSLNAPQRAGVR